METYFTSDLHLRHKNIIQYAHRNPPFGNVVTMDSGLIANWNKVVKPNDKIYHIGDLCFTNNSKVYGDAMHIFHGRTVFLRGNHDSGLQHASYFICRRINGIKIFMRHWPPWEHPASFPHVFDIDADVDLILCGHVHDKWKSHVHSIGQRLIPVINVGVDVWEYKPVNLGTIVKEAKRLALE
jgi:calcineurin-like phosphoesterase family protein